MVKLQLLNTSSSKRHDVFLSFRGEDTRDNFSSHLCDALIRKQVETYVDYRLEKGDEISQALIQAIKESHVSIVIFSEKYATSKWCLDEISEIIECKEEQGQIVIPVFYKVDPSHVRKQRGTYEKAFAQHEQDLKGTIDKVHKWRDALTKAADLAGYDFRTYRTEAVFIEDIVKDVLQKLNVIYPSDYLKGLVGIERSYATVESLLKIGSTEIRVIGIWGMGGIGKTTLANVLYSKLSSQFEGHCFLPSVREQSEKHGLDVLRNKLFSELLEEETLHAYVPKVGSHFKKRRLACKKVFIVLDDVATSEQLEDLIVDCLGPGSRVIVTTRDKQIISHVDKIYEVKELNDHDSLQLFCLNAFIENLPKYGFEELSKSVIAYCQGSPLALKMLGARLRSRSEKAWESELRRLQKNPNMEIHNVLKFSFDDLNRTEQDIFLDIACFLKGERRDHILSLLEAYNFFPEMGIEVLVDKSLITISHEDRIEMHDLVQEMGWNIVRQESIKELGRRSRLWDFEEVSHVLKYNEGTEAIEGMMLDMSKIEDLHLSFDSFTKMTNIRFLKLYDTKRSGRCKIYLPKNGLELLSDKLRYLEWHGYCSKSLPSTFSGDLLVEISMPNSKLEKLWDGVQNLANLKKIDLRFWKNLVEVPDLSMAKNLKTLYLVECESLREVHPSILSLQELQILQLKGCTRIESLQSDVHLRSLQFLFLSNCSSLKEFSVSSVELQRLWLDGTSIQELPQSIWRCAKLDFINAQGCDNLGIVGEKLSYYLKATSLRYLYLSGCKQLNASNLCVMLDGWRSLLTLELRNCCNLQTLPENIGLLSSLECLYLSGSNIESLPANIKNLLRLNRLYLDNCRKLVYLPELPRSLCLFSAVNCTSLVTNFTQFISFTLKHGFGGLDPDQSFILPGAHLSDRFSFRSEGTSVTIPHLPHSGLCGFISYVNLSQSPPHVTRWDIECFLNINSKRIKEGISWGYGSSNLISDHVFLWYVDFERFGDVYTFRRIQKSGARDLSNVSFNFFLKNGVEEFSTEGIKGCGVYPVYVSGHGCSFKQNEKELEFGDSSRDIVELEFNCFDDIDELQHRAIGFERKGSNHNNEDGQTKKLKQVIHQKNTSVQHVEVDSNKNSSCHSLSGKPIASFKHLANQENCDSDEEDNDKRKKKGQRATPSKSLSFKKLASSSKPKAKKKIIPTLVKQEKTPKAIELTNEDQKEEKNKQIKPSAQGFNQRSGSKSSSSKDQSPLPKISKKVVKEPAKKQKKVIEPQPPSPLSFSSVSEEKEDYSANSFTQAMKRPTQANKGLKPSNPKEKAEKKRHAQYDQESWSSSNSEAEKEEEDQKRKNINDLITIDGLEKDQENKDQDAKMEDQASDNEENVKTIAALLTSQEIKAMIDLDPLAAIYNLIGNTLSRSPTKTHQYSVQEVNKPTGPVNERLNSLRSLIFKKSLLKHLLREPTFREDIQATFKKVEEVSLELSPYEKKGVEECRTLFEKFLVTINTVENIQAEFKRIEQNKLDKVNKLKKAQEKLSNLQKGIEVATKQEKKIETQISDMEEKLKKLKEERALLNTAKLKCEEQKKGCSVDMKNLSNEMTNISAKEQEIEVIANTVNADYEGLEREYNSLKAFPPF